MSQAIKSYCPACKSRDTVFIGSGGYLTCSWVDCPNPDYLKAWSQHVEDVRGSTWKMALKEIDHWKRYAELLQQNYELGTEPKMVIEANPKSQIFVDSLSDRANAKPKRELAPQPTNHTNKESE